MNRYASAGVWIDRAKIRKPLWAIILVVLLLAPIAQLVPSLFALIATVLAASFLTPFYYSRHLHMSAYFRESGHSEQSQLGVIAKTVGSIAFFAFIGWWMACPVRHNYHLILVFYLFAIIAELLLYRASRKHGGLLCGVMRVSLFKYGLFVGVLYSLTAFVFTEISFLSSFVAFFERDLCGAYLNFQAVLTSAAYLFPAPLDQTLSILFNMNITFGLLHVLYAHAVLRCLDMFFGMIY